MAGEFCQKRDGDGRRCIIASEHYGPCAFGAQRPSSAEVAIYGESERSPPSCLCGKSGLHDRTPMCAVSPAWEAAIYERGGHVPPATPEELRRALEEEAARRATERAVERRQAFVVLAADAGAKTIQVGAIETGVPDIAQEQREAWAQNAVCVADAINLGRATHPGGVEVAGVRVEMRHSIAGTPATMLGEALAALGRVEMLLDAADPDGANMAYMPVLMMVARLQRRVEELKREADAMEKKP